MSSSYSEIVKTQTKTLSKCSYFEINDWKAFNEFIKEIIANKHKGEKKIDTSLHDALFVDYCDSFISKIYSKFIDKFKEYGFFHIEDYGKFCDVISRNIHIYEHEQDTDDEHFGENDDI